MTNSAITVWSGAAVKMLLNLVDNREYKSCGTVGNSSFCIKVTVSFCGLSFCNTRQTHDNLFTTEAVKHENRLSLFRCKN